VPMYLQLVLRLHTGDMADSHCAHVRNLVLRLHTSDMADYHCARVLTSGIAFTYS
jgi:hypothetical protein